MKFAIFKIEKRFVYFFTSTLMNIITSAWTPRLVSLIQNMRRMPCYFLQTIRV